MASIISASTTSSTALNLSGDTTGILQLATGATPTTAVTIDASQNVTFAQPLTLTTPALGTPASGNLVNCTGVANTAKAWVSYKGTVTRAINASFNVSSVTYNSAGNYTINFTSAFADANYAGIGTAGIVPATSTLSLGIQTKTTTACTVATWESYGAGPFTDSWVVDFVVFR